MIILASSSGNTVPVIARLVAADEKTVREVSHASSDQGLSCLAPKWAGGRPRLLTPNEEDLVIQTATTRPTKLGRPFTRWSLRKLAAYLAHKGGPGLRIGRETLRTLLHQHGVTFQRTTTWKDSPDPEADAKLDRIEHVMERLADRVFAFDEFGPLGIRPTAGTGWARKSMPDRIAATYRRTHSHHLLPWLLLGGLRHLVGHQSSAQRRREHAHGAQVDSGRPPGRRSGLRDPGQPVRAQGSQDPLLGPAQQGRVVFHPYLRLLG